MNSLILPDYEQIPNVGLYLDQVARFINEIYVNHQDMMLTTSMISNYVKLKLVSKPDKKLYNREQISQFLFISLAKNVTSLDNIRTFLKDNPDAYKMLKDELDNDTELKSKETNKLIIHNIAIALTHKIYLDELFKKEQ